MPILINMEMNVASSSSLSFDDIIKTNKNSVHESNESTPERILVRVKRRRSRSPAEALLLTDNVSTIKRTKIGKLWQKFNSIHFCRCAYYVKKSQ